MVLRQEEGNSTEPPTTAHSRHRKPGLIITSIIGAVGVALMAGALPFVTPAMRRYGLPYLPSTPLQLEKVLQYLKGRKGKVVDLGSGDGRVVIAATKQGHPAVGFELNYWLVLYSRWTALVNGVHKRAKFQRKNLWKVDLSQFENIVIFGVEDMMQPLGEKIAVEAPPTARVIACRFQIPEWEPVARFEAGPHSVFVYDTDALK